jgi:hypothetical protein
MGYLAQHILGAANEDYENWMQMVVFVIVGIFWVIGGILKARANKLKDRNEQETEEPGGKAGLKRPRQGRQPVSVAAKTSYPQRQAVVRPRADQGRPPQAVAEPKVFSPKEAIQSRPLSAVEPLKTPKDKAFASQAEEPLQLDLGDPEQLRRAIVYYEILGKPLALRGLD